jgi:hypothetical protein
MSWRFLGLFVAVFVLSGLAAMAFIAHILSR